MIKHRSPRVILSLVLTGLLAVFLTVRGGNGQEPQKPIMKKVPNRLASVLDPVIITPLGQSKPELCIQDLTISKSGQPLAEIKGNVSPGESIGLHCSIWNLGLAVDPSQWWKIGFYIDGVLVGTNDRLGLPSGRDGLAGYGCSAPMTEGVHYFECRLDIEGAIDEADKRNNRAEIPFRVGPPTPVSGELPDLIVKEICLDGTRLVAWIQNIGGKSVNGVEVTLYVNGSPWNSPVFRAGTNLEIKPGDNLSFTNYYWKIFFDPSFVYKIVVDPANKIAESRETNNSMSVRFAF